MSDERIRAQHRHNTLQVLYLCRMTEEEYDQLIDDTAKGYVLRHYTGGFETADFLNSPVFRRWWLQHWQVIDDRYFLSTLYKVKIDRYSIYRRCHQYVFDGSVNEYHMLLIDFYDMLPKFEQDIIKTHKHELQSKNQS